MGDQERSRGKVVVDLSWVDEDEVVITQPLHHSRRFDPAVKARLVMEGAADAVAIVPDEDAAAPPSVPALGSRRRGEEEPTRLPRWQIWH